MLQPSDPSRLIVPCKAPFIAGSRDLRLSHKGIWGSMHNIAVNAWPPDAGIFTLQFHSENRIGQAVHASLAPGFNLSIYRSLWSTGVSQFIFQGSNTYMLSLRLSGHCLESLADKEYLLGGYTCTLFNMANDHRYTFEINEHEPLTEICIEFNLEFLQEKFNLGEAELASLLQPDSSMKIDPLFSQCTVSPPMLKIARALLNADSSSRVFRLFAEAKALELIAVYLSELERQANAAEKFHLKQRELSRIYRVKASLESNYLDPPDLTSLCHLSGFNRRNITEIFKAQFGKTIHEYVQYLRMEKAKELLSSGKCSVALVAEEVGYDHQSNFATAFKRYAGLSPLKYSAQYAS